jgi:hypothetical protein
MLCAKHAVGDRAWYLTVDKDNFSVAVDEKLARGLTRQAERAIFATSDEARRESFAFARALLDRNREDRKIDGPGFNVPLARLAKAAQENAATLRLDVERFAIGHPGVYHRLSLQPEQIHHLRASKADFVAREWAVAVDNIQVQRGNMTARFWTAPVFFDNHIMTRYLQRGTGECGERIIDLVEAGLPLAGLYRACALTADGSRFHTLDVALPAPGGVLCGGTELVDCAALAYRFLLGHRRAGWGIDAEVAATTLQMTVSLRTYLSDETLSSGQMAVAIELRRWFAAHEAQLRAAPQLAYGWPAMALSDQQTALVEAFRPLATSVQHEFTSWRRDLQKDGYSNIKFDALAKDYIVPEWRRGSVGLDLLTRYMKTDMERRPGG